MRPKGSLMTKRIVILGGGTGGTLSANRLHRYYRTHRADDQRVEIVVVDQDNHHVYQPALLFVPFGLADHQEFVRPRREQLHHDVEFIEDTIDRVDLHRDTVVLDGGRELAYDALIIATGATLATDETPGLTGPGWNEHVFTFYDLAGATALKSALEDFDGASCWSTSLTCPSSVQSLRWSSASSLTGSSLSAAFATR